MRITGFGDRTGVKGKDIKDVEKRTTELIKSLMTIHDQLVGTSAVDGLVNLTRIVTNDPQATEFRQKLDKLIARLFSMIDTLVKELTSILGDLKALQAAGHDIILIKDEDRIIESLTMGFTLIGERLAEMRTQLKNLLQSDVLDREQLAMEVLSHYIAIVEELKQLHPVEEQLDELYALIDRVI